MSDTSYLDVSPRQPRVNSIRSRLLAQLANGPMTFEDIKVGNSNARIMTLYKILSTERYIGRIKKVRQVQDARGPVRELGRKRKDASEFVRSKHGVLITYHWELVK